MCRCRGYTSSVLFYASSVHSSNNDSSTPGHIKYLYPLWPGGAPPPGANLDSDDTSSTKLANTTMVAKNTRTRTPEIQALCSAHVQWSMSRGGAMCHIIPLPCCDQSASAVCPSLRPVRRVQPSANHFSDAPSPCSSPDHGMRPSCHYRLLLLLLLLLLCVSRMLLSPASPPSLQPENVFHDF